MEIVQDMFNKSNKKMRLVDENELEVEYDVIIKFEVGENQESEITPRQSITTEKEEASVRTRLKITYFLSADNEEIKVTNVSGSWEKMYSYTMYFNDSEVMVTDGVPGHETTQNTLRAYPESDSFSYDTGWDYVTKYPGSTDAYSGARAFSETTASIEGMGGTYTIFTTVVVP